MPIDEQWAWTERLLEELEGPDLTPGLIYDPLCSGGACSTHYTKKQDIDNTPGNDADTCYNKQCSEGACPTHSAKKIGWTGWRLSNSCNTWWLAAELPWHKNLMTDLDLARHDRSN